MFESSTTKRERVYSLMVGSEFIATASLLGMGLSVTHNPQEAVPFSSKESAEKWRNDNAKEAVIVMIVQTVTVYTL